MKKKLNYQCPNCGSLYTGRAKDCPCGTKRPAEKVKK
jgi:predicted RNA-binding Zn-ribbon protein involved in translation (DUF1610 family)